MKRLYLIRHAKSSWNNPILADFDRPLNKRGRRTAPLMGKRLKKYKVYPDMMISSPAKRAITTARLIADELNFPKGKIITDNTLYNGSMLALLKAIQQIENKFNYIFIFGHNPEFTMLSNYLSNYKVANIPTCGIFCLDFDILSWREISEGTGEFKFFDYPKKHLSTF